MPPSLRIATVNAHLPGHEDHFIRYYERSSLLDYDVVLFYPDMTEWPSVQEKKLGHYLSPEASRSVWASHSHWKNELGKCLAGGGTVFVPMAPLRGFLVECDSKQPNARWVYELQSYYSPYLALQAFAWVTG